MPRLTYILTIIFFWSVRLLFSQQRSIDSLTRISFTQKEDTNKIITWMKIANIYNLSGNIDSSDHFVLRSYTLASSLKNIRYMVVALSQQATNLRDKGRVKEADVIGKVIMTKSDSARYEPGRAAAYSTLGGLCTMQNEFRQAENYFLKSLDIYTKLGLKSKITALYNSLGWTVGGSGDYKKAVNYLLLALESARSDTNTRLIGMVNLNLAEVYNELKDFDKALELNKTSYTYYIKSGDMRGQALAVGNMGSIYSERNDIKQAISYFDAAMDLCRKTGYYTGWLTFLANKNELCLTIYKDIKNAKYKHVDSVLDLLSLPHQANRLGLLKDSIRINQRRADSLNTFGKNNGISNILSSAKALYELLNDNYKKSIELFLPCIAVGEASKDNRLLLHNYLYISEAYQKENDYPKAFGYLKKYLQLNDSVSNDEKKKSVLKSQAEYEFKEKEFQLRSEKEKQKLVFDIEKGKQKTQRIYFVVILVLFAGGLAAVAIGYRRKSKDHAIIFRQKEEIEKQKNIVDEKNKEVYDSISYAKRLQKAILPPLSLVKEYLPQSFILYKPKDIVAGDFYWMHISSELRVESSEKKAQRSEQPVPNSELILIAAADCTGHGVPGAMVSVVCSNALNRAVHEFGLTDPGKILDKTRELVIETFEKSEEKVSDGMDISLCSILRVPGSGSSAVQWAGANSPLVYTQNNTTHELKANKQPIGIVEKPDPFTTHTLQLNHGDCVYLFTDGYPDQFGGPNGKKYKHKPFVSLIDRVRRQPVSEQEQLLERELASWKGNINQVDDILIIGFKL